METSPRIVWHRAADMNNFGIQWRGKKAKSHVPGARMGLDRSPCRQQEAVQDPAVAAAGLWWEVLLSRRKCSAPVSYSPFQAGGMGQSSACPPFPRAGSTMR